jgi:glycosyltransferase involved in cell wall biosynthesis
MSDPSVIGDRDATVRVAIVADAIGGAPGLEQTLAQIAEHGVPGCHLELIVSGACDARSYDVVHIFTHGPLGGAWLRGARALETPVATSYDPTASPALYHDGDVVLSPSRAADVSLYEHGISPGRIARFQRGVDIRCYHPARYAPDALPAAPEPSFNVLHVGEHGLELAAEAFLVARDRDPHLRLVLANGGTAYRARLGSRAVFLGELGPEQLARVYASSDLLLLTDCHDLFGDSVLEAQASGLPVLAVDAGAAPELIWNGRSGCLVSADPTAVAAAIRGLARRAAVLERLVTGGLRAIRERSWEGSLRQLADAYALAIEAARTRGDEAAVPEVARAA